MYEKGSIKDIWRTLNRKKRGTMGMFTRLFCFVLLPFLVSNKDIITVLKELKTEMKMVNRRLTQVEQKLDAVDIDKGKYTIFL